MKSLIEYSIKVKHIEIGGIILGEYGKYKKTEFIDVKFFILASKAISFNSSIIFTNESLMEIHNCIENEFKGMMVLGWFHTHPRYGIFLSEQDQFIDNYFFSEPYHISFVIDPYLSWPDNIGVFVWEYNEKKKLKSGFFIY